MIRRYRDEDLADLLVAWHTASQVAHPFLDEEFLGHERARIADHYLPNSETWVYEREGVVVGFISLSDEEVGGLFVDAAFHGQGIGRALMDHARSTRAFLELDVFKDNPVGRTFYERYGFRQVGEHVDEDTGFAQLRLRLEG